MADQLNNFNFTFAVRSAPKRGPTSSDNWNDMMEELANDLANISNEWNTKLVEIISALPDGTLDTAVNVFRSGLDGKTMWVDQGVTSSSDDLTFFNSTKNRPNTVKEQFDYVVNLINVELEAIREELTDTSSGLTTDQKNSIGANIFDDGQTSSATSLDGKSENNRKNIIQLADDLYGDSAQLNNDGIGILTNANIKEMLQALLLLHGSDWNTGTAPSHTGAFTATQADISTSHPGNDSFTGTPTTLEGDLNRIRNEIKELRGTGNWQTANSLLYAGGADSLEDLLASTQGTGVKAAANPWGYNYSDIDGLNTRLEAIKTFTGQNTQTDTSPTYSGTNYINNSDSLETAIGKLDIQLGITAPESAANTAQLAALETYTGQTNDADNSPVYLSTAYVANGMDLTEAIGTLDDTLLTISGLFQSQISTLSGVQNFVDLNDVPSFYSTHANKVLTVSPTEDSLVFSTVLVSGNKLYVNDGDIEIVGSGLGLILASPDGVRWKIEVTNSGVLTTTAL